jgi:hypothetical protein
MGERLFETTRVEQDGLRIELVVQPAVNYALVVNHVPLVRELTLTNRSDLSVHGVALTLTIDGPSGPIAPPWTAHLPAPLPPGRSVTFADFTALAPDTAGIVAADEAYPVEIRLEVTRPDHSAVRAVVAARVLAHDEWLNHPALYDSLAAFVQPNNRGVDTVLRAAGEILLRHTGSAAIEGYQGGPDRAARIAGAVYEALRQFGVACQGGMASIEEGQKIRTVSAVVQARLANCLDLAVGYAACLAQAGLHPLIWLTETHALGGFFLEPERLGAITETGTNLLMSLADAGRAIPVELTGMDTMDFAGAVRAGLARLRPPHTDLRAAVDVALAHRSGIRPLPVTEAVVLVEDTGRDHVGRDVGPIELPAGAARDRLAQRAAEFAEVGDAANPAPARVRQWQRALLDLSLRNPLLNLPSRGKGVDLHVPVDALKDLDDLVHLGRKITLVAQDAVSQVHKLAGARGAQDLDPAILARELSDEQRVYAAVGDQRYRTVLSGLQRAARTMVQETGGNYLYLTLGTLVHPKDGGGEAHAPLFLLPVRIEGGLGRAPYQVVIDGTEIASPNHCLVEWLRVKHGVRIAELERPLLDEAGIDIPRTLQALRDGLVANRLNYRIDESASLRLLQYGTFQMWRDLTDHWESFMDNPVVGHLVSRQDIRFTDPAGEGEPALDEAELALPIEADGSQLRAVVMAQAGRSFVLEGPPGTGKSQTITNMIARAVQSGQTVLFVAEKQAALDVVKRRLDRVGLGPFVLDLHGRKQSLAAIRAQLLESLAQTDPGDDGSWEPATTRLRGRLAPLVRYPRRVHDGNALGTSLWQAYQDVSRYGDGPAATVPAAHLAVPADLREAALRALADLPPLAAAARPRGDHPWALSDLRAITALDHEAVLFTAGRLDSSRQALALRPGLAEAVRCLPAPAAIGRLLPVAALARDGQLPDRETLRAAEPSTWDEAIGYAQSVLAALWQDFGEDLARFRDKVLWAPLDDWLSQAREAADKVLWWRSKGLQRVAEQLTPYLRSRGTIDLDDLPQILARLVTARLVATDAGHQVARAGGVRLPAGWRPTRDGAPDEFARAVQASRICRGLLRDAPPAWDYLATEPSADDHDVLVAVDEAWREWSALLFATDESLRLWGAGAWYDAWQRDGARWLRELRDDGMGGLHRWSALLACTDALAHAGLPAFRQEILRGQIGGDDALLAYRRGLAARNLNERVQAGDLAYFEPGVHNGQIDQYEEADTQVRAAAVGHLPALLVRRRGEATAVELAEQLKRRRGGLSFRELFDRYAQAILRMTPCVLVSPASAAQFISPTATKFDIVIFDEASQIRVAEAIGAMGRGVSTVIVGDSKQMPPTSVRQASHADLDEDADDEQAPEDLDSILSEAVESRVPQHLLTWHYRSRDESLIAFSNRRYYDSRLYTLPSPAPGTGGSSAVGWRRVPGTFNRGHTRTNGVEAQAVVEEIGRRLGDPATAHESIGVVTFNIQQRDLILDLLESSNDPQVRAAMAETLDEPIFVKNLENVQGDERDTVLFSLAYSTDPDTGLLPLTFGPLSQAGGERRLNVAVTRAKRQVLLFASFDPPDIDLSRTIAQGTRDLRAYCELAANGPDSLGDLAPARHRGSDDVREQVAAALADRGHDVLVGLGLSEFTVDIAVRRPGSARWQVAIILDGPDWARRSTVADRDRAPRFLTREMGWPGLVRFWLPAWLRDRESFLGEVDDAVRLATAKEQEQEQAPAIQPAEQPVPAEPPTEPALEQSSQGTRPLAPAATPATVPASAVDTGRADTPTKVPPQRKAARKRKGAAPADNPQ